MLRLIFGASACLVIGTWVLCSSHAEDDSPKRTAWTTGKVSGSPEAPPPYKLTLAFPKLKFDHPIQFVSLAGTDRLFVVEQAGRIFTFKNTPDATAELFFDPVKDLTSWKQIPKATEFETTFSLVFHPDFAQNKQCFICYTAKGKNIPNLDNGTTISRFSVDSDDGFRVNIPSEEKLLSFKQGGHNGCDMHFGADGMLYISTGDAADPNPPDSFRTGQDISDLEASVLRIDVNKKDLGKNYAIPADNPFVGMTVHGKRARGEVWAYGFRNAWRMSFDRVTNQLWVGDVGWELWELVHKVNRGHNGGWSLMEGPQTVNTTWPAGPTPVTQPSIEVPHTEGASMTGGYVYRGEKFPALVGHYIFGDWVTKRIWAADVSDGQPKPKVELCKPTARVVAFGEDADKELYIVDYDDGTILTLQPNNAATLDPSKFPRTLSASGLFTDTKSHTVAPGLREFEINAHQWQDYTTSTYHVALPHDGMITDYPNKKRLPNNVSWHNARFHFPKDAVLVKTISLEMERGNPKSAKRIETQLMHFDGEMWAGYTYAWRDDQTDADLVPTDGAEKHFSVIDPVFAGGKREQTWTFFSRTQCVQCHHSWAEYTLAFNLEQLNRPIKQGDSEQNQLISLVTDGFLNRKDKQEKSLPNYREQDLAKDRKLANPHDATAKLEDWAKAYFHVNCGHCHRFGGGGGVDFELHAFCDLKSKKVYDAKPVRGTLELNDARIIAPGEPYRSTIYARMAKFGLGRMPHIGSEFVDEAGVALIGDWITSLGKPNEVEARLMKLDTMEECMTAARLIGTDKAGDKKMELLATASKLPTGTRRDLFEGYLPGYGTTQKVGTNPKPRSILALQGDAANGKQLFQSERLQCAKCHQVSGVGVAVGPELTKIAKTRIREHLLESMLDPSRRIEQAFVSIVVNLADGRSLTGIQTKKTDRGWTLKKSDGTEVTLYVADIETQTTSPQSLMPSGLLADSTPQQAADLLAYLLTLK